MAIGTISNVYPGGERPSGLPVDIVQRLVNARRQETISPIETERQQLQSERDLLQKLNGQVKAVGDAARQLDSASELKSYVAGSSKEDAVGVSITGTPSAGSYRVNVNQAAKAQTQLIGVDDGDGATGVTQGVSDPDDANKLNTGIEVSFAHGGSQSTYTTDGDTTLNSLASKIRGEDNGVAASVVNIGTSDTPQYVLQLKSESTGSGENEITKSDGGAVGVKVTDPDGTDSLFTTGAVEQETAQAGQNAEFTVDGVSYTRSSNTVSDVIEGVSLEIKGQTSTEANIEIARDPEQATKSAEALVKSLNGVGSFLDQQTRYNQDSGEAGPLLGNPAARQVDSALRNTLISQVPGTEGQDLQYLSQVGIGFTRDGEVTLDKEQFQSALANRPKEVETLLAGGDGAMRRMVNEVKALTNSVDGTITAAIDTYENRDQRLQEEIQAAKDDLQRYDERLSQKYSQLEKTVQELQALEGQLGNMLDLSGGD